MAHACNSSYSGGRDQEDHGSKPALTNSSRDPISKEPITRFTGSRPYAPSLLSHFHGGGGYS
jgi:hypothetical protein